MYFLGGGTSSTFAWVSPSLSHAVWNAERMPLLTLRAQASSSGEGQSDETRPLSKEKARSWSCRDETYGVDEDEGSAIDTSSSYNT